jgi:hypothetical protein
VRASARAHGCCDVDDSPVACSFVFVLETQKSESRHLLNN